jgi:hypothetical protein
LPWVVQTIFSEYWKNEPTNHQYNHLMGQVGEWLSKEKRIDPGQAEVHTSPSYVPANVYATFDDRFWRPLVKLQSIMWWQVDLTYRYLLVHDEESWFHQVSEIMTLALLPFLESLRKARLMRERMNREDKLERQLKLELKYLYFGGRLSQTPLVVQLLGHIRLLMSGSADPHGWVS